MSRENFVVELTDLNNELVYVNVAEIVRMPWKKDKDSKATEGTGIELSTGAVQFVKENAATILQKTGRTGVLVKLS